MSRIVALAAVAAAVAALGISDAARAATPTARGSVEQVQVTGAAPGARVALVRHGRTVASRRAGSLGGVVFRRVDPGRGYRVRTKGSRSAKLEVLPDRSA